MSTNAETVTAVPGVPTPTIDDGANATSNANNPRIQQDGPSLTEALTLRRNLLQSLWMGVRQLPRGRRIVLMIRLAVSFAQIVAFIPILALPGSHHVSPSHEAGRVCNPDSLFKYLVVHIVRLALDIPVELYLGLSPHRTRRGRRAGPEARAIAERDRPLGSEYLDMKIGKISTVLGIASLVIFFVGNAIVYSSTECSQKPAEAVPLFWTALASLIVVYVFILEIALLAFLIVCALPLLIMVMRALGLAHRLPQRELHPETGKIDQKEVDKRVKLVYYTPAEEEQDDAHHDDESTGVEAQEQLDQQGREGNIETVAQNESTPARPGIGSRQSTQVSVRTVVHPALGRLRRLSRLLIARRRSETSSSRLNHLKSARDSGNASTLSSSTLSAETGAARSAAQSKLSARQRRGKQLKYPLHPLPAHRATCPICLCDFEEPQLDDEPESEIEPEPLRLLECGHVMHKTCVDQWLTTVSGRCPVCQKAVIPQIVDESRVPSTTQGQVADAAGQTLGQQQPTEAEHIAEERDPARIAAAPAIEAHTAEAHCQNSTASTHLAGASGSTTISDAGPQESHELQRLPSGV